MGSASMLHGKVFRGSDAIAAGLVTPASLRSRSWQRLFQGIYAHASLRPTHELRCAAAMGFLAPTGAVVAGRSAATLYGAGVGAADDPVELLIPSNALPCRHTGVRVHRGDLSPADRRELRRITVTSPQRTCWDLAQWLERVEAVVWLDRMLALGRVTLAELSAYQQGRRQTRGARRFATVLSLVDGRAESPQESRLRVRLAVAGLRPPAVQYEIYDDAGRFVARVDLAWPDKLVAVEYDGLWHVGSAAQLHADRRRLSGLASLGWTVLPVTSARLRDDFEGVRREIRAALRRR